MFVQNDILCGNEAVETGALLRETPSEDVEPYKCPLIAIWRSQAPLLVAEGKQDLCGVGQIRAN